MIRKIHKFGNTLRKAYRSTKNPQSFKINHLSKVGEENLSEIFSEME